MGLAFMPILDSFCAGFCSNVKTVIDRVTYEIGVHTILDSFCAGFCSRIKTVIGRVTNEFGVVKL